jgi:anhydro-N-acetylmuramic acid kinase
MVAIGLMSGTSRDGIDAAMIETDGETSATRIAFVECAYTPAVRELIANACAIALTLDVPTSDPVIGEATRILTLLHIEAVRQLLRAAGREARDVDVIGFHGHTVAHRPDRGWTWQIGDAALMAQICDIDVVHDFRSADVAAGGQGAPLLPVYHRALAAGLELPAVILNLGGVANITFVGRDGELIACDTGMANALIDDWMLAMTGESFDRDGALAAQGQVNEVVLGGMLDHPFFDAPPPKSLDRHDFSLGPIRGLSAADGAATLAAFTAQGVALTLRHLPERAHEIWVAGGGRKNAALMAMIEKACGVPVVSVDALGWNGDAIEAEGFAFMAARTIKFLPISFPGTTGVPQPEIGGRVTRAGNL